MNDRFANMKASVLTALGYAAADAAVDTTIAPAADASDQNASDDNDEDEQSMPKKGKKKMPPADCEDGADADASADDADVAAALTETATAAASAATKAANARWGAVIGSAEAEGRVALAANLLGTTDMSADAIKATLKLAPKAGAGTLSSRMESVGNPAVSADADAAPTLDPKKAAESGWDAAYAKLPGNKAKAK